MSAMTTSTKIIAGAPIQAGGRRFLPSVMVTTLENNAAGGIFHVRRMRPISVVEEDTAGKRWHNIPDVTQNMLSQMAVAALVVAGVASLILLLNHLIRR